jgi:hypothetical protein
MKRVTTVLRVVGVAGCLLSGVWGLSGWLFGSGGAVDDSAASAGVTTAFVVTLLAGVSLPVLNSMRRPSLRLRRVQSAALLIFVFFVIATINSLGAWLLLSAVFAVLVWVLSRPSTDDTSNSVMTD